MRTDWQYAEALATARGNDPEPACSCCDFNDFEPVPDMETACVNCGHSVEEHEPL